MNHRPISTSIVALSVALLGISPSHAAEPSIGPTPTSAVSHGSEAEKAAAAAKQTARTIEHIWWNQPEVVKTLELKDAQRTKMDKVLADALAAQHATQQQQVEARQALTQALAQGQWAAARTAATALRDGAGKLMAAQIDLKIDVLSQLDDKQRQTLTERYRYLLQRPWLTTLPFAGRGGRLGKP